MALIACPECHGQVSDSAITCPHCGYPIAATSTATGQTFTTTAGLSPEEAAKIFDQVRTGLKSAGLGDLFTNAGVDGRATVTTSAAATTAATPNPIPYAAPYAPRNDYRSALTLFGLPLLAISRGYDPMTGRKRVARGIIAVGDVAVGLIAVGGTAFGGVTLGGLSVGLVSLGGLSIGLVLAIGGAAIGGLAIGGGAVGLYAAGGGAFGLLKTVGANSFPR